MIGTEDPTAPDYGGSSPSEDVLLTILDRALRRADDATDRKKDILYLIYLGVLGFCCLSPCFYYLRLHMWQRHFFRQMREQERSSLALAVARSAQATQHEQPSDCDERVREERRARILQLMEPVRMTLKEDHFREISPAEADAEQPISRIDAQEDDFDGKELTTLPDSRIEEDEEMGKHKNVWKSKVCKLKVNLSGDATSMSSAGDDGDSRNDDQSSLDNDDEGSRFIEIPLPGLVIQDGTTNETTSPIATPRTDTKRVVPAFCAVCLSSYSAGTEIVWSSNNACRHVFHQDCMEQYLMKLRQRDGSICPCCRREFLIDPYDLVPASASSGDDLKRAPSRDEGAEA